MNNEKNYIQNVNDDDNDNDSNDYNDTSMEMIKINQPLAFYNIHPQYAQCT